MDATILVVLKARSQIHQVMSYLESLARPHTRVIFLLRAAVPRPEWIAGYWSFAHTGTESSFGRCAPSGWAAVQQEESLADAILAPWQQTFRYEGVQLEVAVYTGRISQMLESMVTTEQPQFLLTPASRMFAVVRMFGFLRALFGSRAWNRPVPLKLLKE